MRRLLLAALLSTAGSVPAWADMPGDVPDKVRFAFGELAANTYSDAAYRSKSAGVGGSINFEDVFGLPGNKWTGRFELSWRLTKRQFIDFGYFRLNRSGSRILEEDVPWGDYIFHADGEVAADFNTQFPYAAWRYAFLDLPQVRISGSVGIDYLVASASLFASGNVTDASGNPVPGDVVVTTRVNAPVPQIGLQIDWALAKQLALTLYVRQIYVSRIGGINGGIGETAVRFQWWYVKHAGISVGFDRDLIDLKSYETGNTRSQFRYDVNGFSFYFNFAF